MKTNSLIAALWDFRGHIASNRASFTMNSARPRPFNLVPVKEEVMTKLLRKILGRECCWSWCASSVVAVMGWAFIKCLSCLTFFCTIQNILSVLLTITCLSMKFFHSESQIRTFPYIWKTNCFIPIGLQTETSLYLPFSVTVVKFFIILLFWCLA